MGRSNNRSRFQLSATQARTIHDTAKTLSPEQRHGFLLRVGRTLNLSATPRAPWVSDNLVTRAIEHALAEVAA